MAAITGCVFVKRVPVGGACAGALVKEIWKIPASSDGDTQTLALPFIKTVLGVTGPVTMAAQTVDNSLSITTTSTIDASTFSHFEIIGTE